MKRIIFISILCSLATCFVSCQEDKSLQPDVVNSLNVTIDGAPNADLSRLQADVNGHVYTLCIKTSVEYKTELSAEWITIGETEHNTDRNADLLTLEVMASDNPLQKRTATVTVSADGFVDPVVITITQGADLQDYDATGVDFTFRIDDFKSRYFVFNDRFELYARNPNSTDFVKQMGITLDCTLAVPEQSEAAVEQYNRQYDAQCVLLPADMYSVTSVSFASGRKVKMQLDIDKNKVLTSGSAHPYVLPLKAVTDQNLYQSELFYVVVPNVDVDFEIEGLQTRCFAPGDKFEVVIDNQQTLEFMKYSGISYEFAAADGEVEYYNTNHYADCELLPSEMYDLVKLEDSGVLKMQLNLDKVKIKSENREKPFVLPVKISVEDGLFEKVFYVTVPTYNSTTTAYTSTYGELSTVVNLNGYTQSNSSRGLNQLIIVNANPGNDKAVLYCPGGGYESTKGDSGKIEHLVGTKTTIAILLYRTPCQNWIGRHEYVVEDAYQSLQLLQENAQEWGGYTKIGVSGRSAGGHLAGVTAAYHSDIVDFQILLYPVITLRPGFTHAGSTSRFLGENPSHELIRKWSVDQLVDDTTPRTFLAYATNDETVPSKYNSEQMKLALENVSEPEKHKIMVYDYGKHSSSSWDGFIEALTEWMNQL